jgi:hypothetical protein
MDYLSKKSLSRRSSQRSNRPTNLRSSITKKRSPPKQLNLAQVEDPLLALVAAASNSMPLTPPADDPMFQNLDASTKMPDTPMADQFFEDDDLESEQSETEFDIETTHLVTHAKVYAIAEKYVPLFRHCLLFHVLPECAPWFVGGVLICACSFPSHDWGV